MIAIKKLVPWAIPTVTEPGFINQTGLFAVIMKNAGTSTVELFNGLYTLDPKETISLNSVQSGYQVDLNRIDVKFDTTAGSDNKLQILALVAPDSNC